MELLQIHGSISGLEYLVQNWIKLNPAVNSILRMEISCKFMFASTIVLIQHGLKL